MSIRLQLFLFLFCGIILSACSDYDYSTPTPSTGHRVKVEAITPPVGPPIYVTREVNEPAQ